MNKIFRASAPSLLALCLPALLFSGSSRADEDDAITLVTSYSYQYDSNVFRLRDGQKANLGGGSAQRSDFTRNFTYGLNFSKQISRQQVRFNASRTQARYNHFGLLDNDGHDILGQWLWQVGNDLSGQLRYTRQRYMLGFGDYRILEQNLVDAEALRFEAAYKLTPEWVLFGATGHDEQKNSSFNRRGQDFKRDAVEGGIRYVTRAGASIELLARQAEGDYPNRLFTTGFSNISNSYSQFDVETRLRWQVSGHSRLTASVGQADRQHDKVPERDYQDVYGRFSWEWQPTGQAMLTVNAERGISAVDDLLASYFQTRTYSIVPTWQPTAKLKVDGRFEWRNRQQAGNTPLSSSPLAVLFPLREEDIRSFGVGATWNAWRNLSATANLRRDVRDSTDRNYEFKATSVSMTVQYLF